LVEAHGTGCGPRYGGSLRAGQRLQKGKGPPFLGRRPFGVAAKTPGLAERKVGRSLKFCNDQRYHLTVRLRTDISGVLRSSFFAGSIFLLFFTGFAVGFMTLIPLIKLGLSYPPSLLQSLSQNEILTPLIQTKVFSRSTSGQIMQ
jgi:hypothetical protein